MSKVQERHKRGEKIKENNGETTADITSDDALLAVEEDENRLNLENTEMDSVVDSEAFYHVAPCRDLFTSYKSERFGVVHMSSKGTFEMTLEEYVLKLVREPNSC